MVEAIKFATLKKNQKIELMIMWKLLLLANKNIYTYLEDEIYHQTSQLTLKIKKLKYRDFQIREPLSLQKSKILTHLQ